MPTTSSRCFSPRPATTVPIAKSRLPPILVIRTPRAACATMNSVALCSRAISLRRAEVAASTVNSATPALVDMCSGRCLSARNPADRGEVHSSFGARTRVASRPESQPGRSNRPPHAATKRSPRTAQARRPTSERHLVNATRTPPSCLSQAVPWIRHLQRCDARRAQRRNHRARAAATQLGLGSPERRRNRATRTAPLVHTLLRHLRAGRLREPARCRRQ